MIKEYWKPFKYYKRKYLISNLGRIYSCYKKRLLCGYIVNGKTQIELCYKNHNKKIFLDKLVSNVFKKTNLKNNKVIIHKNNILLDDRNKNLKPLTRKKFMKKLWEKKRRINYLPIGVYKFNSKTSKKKYRAVICINKKPITLAYTNTYQEAYNIWKQEFLKRYNYEYYTIY